jgi:type II secretory pathway component PulK
VARSKGGNQETEMDPLVVVLMIVVVLATWAGLAVWLWRSEHRRQRNTRDRQP